MGDMTRQELVQLHSLLAEVKSHAEDDLGMDVQTPDYDDLDISPIGIHQTCDQQKEATLVLANELADAFERVDLDGVTATAD